MSDITDKTANVSITNNDESKTVTVTTDGAKERLDVSVPNPLPVTSEDNNQLSAGNHYTVSEFLDPLNRNEEKVYLLQIPVGTQPNLKISVQATLEAEIKFLEDVTFSAAGNSRTPYNNNRNSSNTSNVTVTSGPSSPSSGTQIWTTVVPGANQGGTSIDPEFRWIFKEDTDYLIKIISKANGNLLGIAIFWHE